MKFAWIFLVVFGTLIIVFPQFLAYLIWWFFLFVWLNIIIFTSSINNKNKNNSDNRWSFFKIGKYKIYK